MAHLACVTHGKRVMVFSNVGSYKELVRIAGTEQITRTYHRSGGKECDGTLSELEVRPVLTIGGNRISPFDALTSHAESIKIEASVQEYHRTKAKRTPRRRPGRTN